VAQPYIYTSEREGAEVETGEFDDLGPVIETVDGHHSIFAAEVVCKASERTMSREDMLEALERQVRFIASLYRPSGCEPLPNPSLRTFELRFVKEDDGGGAGNLRIAFLGKVFDEDRESSRQLAMELWREVESLFPDDYALRPASSEEEFEAFFLGSLVERIDRGEQVAEIRRYEEFIPMEREERVWEQNYLVYPFVWHAGDRRQVFRAMLAFPGRHILSVSLRPTRLYEAEERFLCDLYATAEKLSKVNWLRSKVQGQIGMQLYTAYLRRLKRPFLMRVQLAGEPAVPMPLAQALGAELTQPVGNEEGSFEVGYELVFPDPEVELEVAVRNFRLLEHDFWGPDLPLAKYRRFRYLVDALWANCAFRLPISERGFVSS